jgi:glycosidase
LEHYKKLIALRRHHPALQLGSYKTILADNAQEAFAFERKLGMETITVAFNTKSIDQPIELPIAPGWYVNALNNQRIEIKETTPPIVIKAKWAVILVKEN